MPCSPARPARPWRPRARPAARRHAPTGHCAMRHSGACWRSMCSTAWRVRCRPRWCCSSWPTVCKRRLTKRCSWPAISPPALCRCRCGHGRCVASGWHRAGSRAWAWRPRCSPGRQRSALATWRPIPWFVCSAGPLSAPTWCCLVPCWPVWCSRPATMARPRASTSVGGTLPPSSTLRWPPAWRCRCCTAWAMHPDGKTPPPCRR